MDYFIITTELGDNDCAIWELPEKMTKPHMPAVGVRMDDEFSNGLAFSMTKDVAGIQISDVIDNALAFLMGSKKLKELLAKHALADIEYLQFTLLNHKGRVASKDCFIMNVIGTVDCVDKDRTEGETSSLTPERYTEIERLFLDDDKINPDLKIFRITSMPELIIVREDLKEKIEEEQITGVAFVGMGEELE
jgi:hypothetical protein